MSESFSVISVCVCVWSPTSNKKKDVFSYFLQSYNHVTVWNTSPTAKRFKRPWSSRCLENKACQKRRKFHFVFATWLITTIHGRLTADDERHRVQKRPDQIDENADWGHGLYFGLMAGKAPLTSTDTWAATAGVWLLTSVSGPLSAPGQQNVTNSWHLLWTTKQQTAERRGKRLAGNEQERKKYIEGWRKRDKKSGMVNIQCIII